jgi:hypothetical protein
MGNKKFFLLFVILIGIYHSGYTQDRIKQIISKNDMKKYFLWHFRKLDSIAAKNEKDSVYYTISDAKSITFMEDNTKIGASTNGTYYGRLGFTKKNLQQWHEWFNRKYGKKYK